MIYINFKTKWGDRIVCGYDEETIFAYILEERIDDGFWYDEAETQDAQRMMENGYAERFMRRRRIHEYEGYEKITVEQAS